MKILVCGIISKDDVYHLCELRGTYLQHDQFLMGYNWDINFRPDDVNNIVRTNCDHFLNGVRVAVKEGKFDPKDIEIKFWSPKEKNLQILSIDKDGRIGLWPRGFFDEWETALMELL